MKQNQTSKYKILNDPIYGFISVKDPLVFKIIEHPYFQRLRRITQTGLTSLVYPGALHTRLQHAIGCSHLMHLAVQTLRDKGHQITPDEEQAVVLGILLHDIGHGPYSHALEHSLVSGLHHEDISLMIMEELNAELDGALDLAITIFKDEYPKRFLHQLISSQLDMDRLDYLKRDSYFTGVTEGVVGSDRLIAMLNVADDQLVIEEKGIYSVEKFIIARRLMYWQVYLHKTVLAGEFMLLKALRRARELTQNGLELFASPPLRYFLENNITKDNFDGQVLQQFVRLDDFDVSCALKEWCNVEDVVLSELSKGITDRNLFRVKISDQPASAAFVDGLHQKISSRYGISPDEMHYLFIQDSIANRAYDPEKDKIFLLQKDGIVKNISESSGQLNLGILTKPETKYFVSYPKVLDHSEMPSDSLKS